MAYNKHTWTKRLGTGLNKFKDTITGQVMALVNQPDSVTQAGTPLREDWLNEMETGIEQAHDGVADLISGDETAGNAAKLGGQPANKYMRRDQGNTIEAGQNTSLNIIARDSGKASIRLHGDNQGTGDVFVGQSANYGGGLEYNGDNNPVTTGAGADMLNLYRKQNGSLHWLMRNHVNSNVLEFRETPRVGSDKIWHAGNDGSGSGLDADKLDGKHASSFAPNTTRSNYHTLAAENLVVGQLAWVRHGNGHTIFDASKGITPVESTCDFFTAEQPYSNTSHRPNLMGFNGTYTYGVRVDSAERAEKKENDLTTIICPRGGSRSYNDATVTGAIKITLPQGRSHTMLRFRVAIYNYKTDESTTIELGGYTHSNQWHKTFAHLSGKAHKIRFSYVAGKSVVYIGESNTLWKYPKIAVTEVIAGHSNNDFFRWNDGWAINITTSIGGVERTIPAAALETGVPAGTINMWYGDANNVPEGWALCDGTNGTPDMRNRFVVGAGGAYGVGTTGGASSVTLSSYNMPSHSHGKGSLTTGTAGAHTHKYTALNDDSIGAKYNSGDGCLFPDSGLTTQSAGAHTHTISGSTASAGGGHAHENRPPFLALHFIMKK